MNAPPRPVEGEGDGGEGSLIDQVLVTVFRNPQSYTGDDVVEISTHGNPFILNQVLQACIQNGARLAEPGEFTARAFLAGKMDLTQAEAVADLIRARTDGAHAAALGQLEGHLSTRVRALRDRLLPLLAHVEVGLDHSDEDHDFLSRSGLNETCQSVQQEIETLLASARVGKILREGLRVALVGKPNVGKSSLLNALLKEERAIVTAIPGTTRDTLEETIHWGGIPVVLTDTAGVREQTTDPVERLGMARTRKAIQSSDLVLCVFDASTAWSEEDLALLKECASKPHVWVVNKTDLKTHWPIDQLQSLNGKASAVAVSAKTGAGLDQLVQTVKSAAGAGESAGETQWTLNVRHQAALQRAQESLRQATNAAQNDRYEECVALELRSALDALGEIVGETTTDDLLGQIFSTFCVGK